MDKDWYLFSSRGLLLLYVAANPDCCVEDIAEAMCLARRTVWGLLGDLRRAGMLHVRKEGRCHHYSVNLDAPFPHRNLKGYPLRSVLGEFVEQARRRNRVA